MDSKKKITISWSGGKDSAFALFRILERDEFTIVHLHTVIGKETKRVGLHGIDERLIESQALSLGIPLVRLYLPASDDHEAYEHLMTDFYGQCVRDGIEAVVFGDLFLEDLKEYRDRMLALNGMEGIYPLWKMNSHQMINLLLEAGFRTVLCAANAKYFIPEDLGKTVDRSFIDTLSPEVDVAGENGEFHTFVYDGPIFRTPIHWRPGAVTKKKYEYKIVDEKGYPSVVISEFWFKELYL